MASISIITACLNNERTLEECIASVKAQAGRIEHIFIDGGSTDGTLRIIENHSTSDTRLVSEPDNGIYDAINKGIKLSGNQIIGILHADDRYADANVLGQVTEVFEDRTIDAVYGDLVYTSGKEPGRITRVWRAGSYARKQFFNGWMPPHPTFFVRRSAYEKHGLYRKDLGTSADYELMLRFLYKEKLEAAYIPRVLVEMTEGGASNVRMKARLDANRMDRKAWKVNGMRPYPWTLLAKPLRKAGQWWIR